MDPADPAIGCKPGFISLGPVSGVGPHIGCCVVCCDHFAKLRSVLARTVGDSSLTDKAKALIDGNMVLVTKAGDRNIDLRFAVSGHAGFGGFIGPDLPGRLACFYCRLPLTTVESDNSVKCERFLEVPILNGR